MKDTLVDFPFQMLLSNWIPSPVRPHIPVNLMVILLAQALRTERATSRRPQQTLEAVEGKPSAFSPALLLSVICLLGLSLEGKECSEYNIQQ